MRAMESRIACTRFTHTLCALCISHYLISLCSIPWQCFKYASLCAIYVCVLAHGRPPQPNQSIEHIHESWRVAEEEKTKRKRSSRSFIFWCEWKRRQTADWTPKLPRNWGSFTLDFICFQTEYIRTHESTTIVNRNRNVTRLTTYTVSEAALESCQIKVNRKKKRKQMIQRLESRTEPNQKWKNFSLISSNSQCKFPIELGHFSVLRKEQSFDDCCLKDACIVISLLHVCRLSFVYFSSVYCHRKLRRFFFMKNELRQLYSSNETSTTEWKMVEKRRN